LIIGNSKSNHLDAQGTFKQSRFVRAIPVELKIKPLESTILALTLTLTLTHTRNRHSHVTGFNRDRSLDRDRSSGETVDRDRSKTYIYNTIHRIGRTPLSQSLWSNFDAELGTVLLRLDGNARRAVKREV